MRQRFNLIFKIVGIPIFIAGLVWFLQGVNILPGSFMTGDPQWAINGSISMMIGVMLFLISSRKN